MITEDYVSFETAKLLKEKGFDQNCATYYLDGQVWRHYHGEVIPKGKQIYAAPTQAITMKWLREVHNLQIMIAPIISRHKEWSFGIYKDFSPLTIKIVCFPTYEKTCEGAIKYCLENLI